MFDRGFQCDKCHSQVIIGDGAVPRENCFKCHFEKERLEKYGDTVLIHDNHIAKNKIECTQCHLAIQHKIVKDIETIADCRTCHTGSHQAQKILFTGQGGKGIDHPMPNVMLEKGLSCKGCHMFHEETGGRLVKSETSVPGEGLRVLPRGRVRQDPQSWQISTRKKLRTISERLSAGGPGSRPGRSAGRAKAGGLLEEAAFNIDVVERGKSVHNITYSQELLAASLTRSKRPSELAGSSYKPDRTSFKPRNPENACLNCHAGIEEINPRSSV